MLLNDNRVLEMLNPDRDMLLCWNLGQLIESSDEEEKYLGLSLALYFLEKHPTIILSDICTNDQVTARDTILKH